MTKNLQAIYEKGVLRLLEPLGLPEQKLVTVAILDEAHFDPLLDPEFAGEPTGDADDAVTIEDVRTALNKITGPLTADFIAEREER